MPNFNGTLNPPESQVEHSGAPLLDVQQSVLINNWWDQARSNQFPLWGPNERFIVMLTTERRRFKPGAGRQDEQPGGGSLGIAMPRSPAPRPAQGMGGLCYARSGRHFPSGNSLSLSIKIKYRVTCVVMDLKGKQRGFFRRRLCLASEPLSGRCCCGRHVVPQRTGDGSTVGAVRDVLGSGRSFWLTRAWFSAGLDQCQS